MVNRKPKRQQSPAQNEARRSNARHSTGPRTEIGKERVALNAVKNGYFADKRAYGVMLRLGEDQNEYAVIYAHMVVDLAPQNPTQLMFVQDMSLIKWQQNRNYRGQTALIVKAQDDLRQAHAKKLKDYWEVLQETPLEQAEEQGLASLPACQGKFERIIFLEGFAINRVKEGQYQDAIIVTRWIYGKTTLTVRGSEMIEHLEQLRDTEEKEARGESAAPTAAQWKQQVLAELKKDRRRWQAEWDEHVKGLRPPTQAEIDACCVPRGKAWRASLRQAGQLDHRFEKRLRLYWDMQKHDRERIEREHAERQFEAAVEDAAVEQAAAAFVGKMSDLIDETIRREENREQVDREQVTGDRGQENREEGTGDRGQGTGRQGTGRQGTGRQGTGRRGTGRQGTGRQGTGRQGTGRQGTGRRGTGRQGRGDRGQGK